MFKNQFSVFLTALLFGSIIVSLSPQVQAATKAHETGMQWLYNQTRFHPVVPGSCDAPAAIVDMERANRYMLRRSELAHALGAVPVMTSYQVILNVDENKDSHGNWNLWCPYVVYMHRLFVVEQIHFIGNAAGALIDMPVKIYVSGKMEAGRHHFDDRFWKRVPSN